MLLTPQPDHRHIGDRRFIIVPLTWYHRLLDATAEHGLAGKYAGQDTEFIGRTLMKT